jgi:hypothetical protein
VIRRTLPEEDYSLVIRTDFSDDEAWEMVCRLIKMPQTPYRFQARVECISDATCDGLTPAEIRSILPLNSRESFVFLVDSEAIVRPDHPVLVVDLYEEPGRTFRVIPSEAWGVENNLSLSNMGFEDFAGSVDDDGVFRGFP